MAALLAAAAGLAACGDSESTGGESSSATAPAPVDTEATPEPVTTEQPAPQNAEGDATDSAIADESAPIPVDGDESPAGEPAPQPVDTSDTNQDGVDAAEEPVPTEPPPAPEPEPAAIGGRAFASDLEPASDFDGNPLPDLVVEDVGRGQTANIRNIFPADRPVLLWAYAPH